MPGRNRVFAVLAVTVLLGSAVDLDAQTSPTLADLARVALKAAGGVKPGEIVFVDGGIHIFPLLEEIAAQVYLAGGQPFFGIGTDRLGEVAMMETPPAHFFARDSAFADFYTAAYEAIDVHIRLPFHAELDHLLARFDADTPRVAAARPGFARSDERWIAAQNESGIRLVEIAYPFRAETVARLPLSKAEHDRMLLEASTVDPAEIDRIGRAVARRLDQGRTMRVTTPGGTDIRLTLAGVPAVVRAPMIAPEMLAAPTVAQRTARLPDGQVAVLLKDDASEGRVVIRGDQCGDTHMTNIRFTVEQGLIRGLEAKSGGRCVMEHFERVSEVARHLSSIHIGLNPAMKVIDEDVGYRPWIALGVVHLNFGFNSDIGGSISERPRRGFPLVNPTIEVDGVTIMRDGRFVAELTAAK